MSKQEPWKKDLAELAATVQNRLDGMEKKIGEKFSNPNGGESEVPLYRCKGKDCSFSTDSIEDYVEHRVKEVLGETKSKPAATDEAKPVPVRHETAKDYLDCPECFPKFEKEFLAKGYRKPEEKKKESGQGLLG